MKRFLRALGGILGVLVVAWLGVCAYLSVTHPRITFAAEDLAGPAAPLPKGFAIHANAYRFSIEWSRLEPAASGTKRPGRATAISCGSCVRRG